MNKNFDSLQQMNGDSDIIIFRKQIKIKQNEKNQNKKTEKKIKKYLQEGGS
jgi:pyoverdine/dityrosine biosynthesis protein Dit1